MAKILLAEDDITMVSLLKTLLKMEGFEVLALDVDADIPAAVDHEKPAIECLAQNSEKRDFFPVALGNRSQFHGLVERDDIVVFE